MGDLYLFRNTLRDLIKPSKLAGVSLMIGILLFIAVVARSSASPGQFDADAAYDLLSSAVLFGFLLVIMSVIFATSIIAQERERKTISYLLTRPIPRWRILIAKFAAIVLGTCIALWVADIATGLALFGPAALHKARVLKDCLTIPIGALAYCGLFTLLGTFFERPLLIGLAYAFGWESWTPYLPGDWSRISLMSYLHALSPHLKPAVDANADTFASPDIAVWVAWTVLGAVIVTTIAASLALFSVREYTAREERA